MKQSSAKTITITLASLAHNATAVSTVIDNSVAQFSSAIIQLTLKSGSSGVIAADSVIVGIRGSNDNSTFTTRLFSVDELISYTTLANATTYSMTLRTKRDEPLPKYWKLFVVNKSGATFDATGGNFSASYVGVLEGNDLLVAPAAANYATATNAIATITYTAVAEKQHTMHGVVVSLTGTTPAANVTVTDNGTVVFNADVNGNVPVFLPCPIIGTVNTNLVVALSAGGSGVVGKLNVIGKSII